ncbi:hypothetical protein TNCV_1738231 [Trichonephila clavipes]|nr:hypothetical protein TNCV_1738231 [Trichonephila clavipes]
MSSSPVSHQTLRVGERYTLNLSRAPTSSRWSTPGLLASDLVIVNYGQVTKTTPEQAAPPSPPSPNTTPTGGRLSFQQI